MYMNTIEITHIFHSGFVVELLDKILVFDYFKDPFSKLNYKRTINSNKDIYVFVTHSHGDHYNPEIFKWENLNPNITYILSSDVEISNPKDNYYFMNKYEEIKFKDFSIKTFGTTDRGVSFLVKIDDLTIFHAGDLNWWHWKKDDAETQRKEEMDFKRELDKLIGTEIDVLFIPVDPRLEEYYYLAGKYAAKTLKPKLLVPMHFGDNYDTTNRFRNEMKDTDVMIQALAKESSSFTYHKRLT